MVHHYCCCAVPLLTPGIYIVLLEQLVLGITAGTVSIATPKVVGAALPSFAPWVFAIFCYVAAAVQVLGFLGVRRESPKLYKNYVRLNALAVTAAFAVAAAFTGVSWGRHSRAVTTCINNFFTSEGTTETDNKSRVLCDVFTWIDVGILTGLVVGLAFVQFYFVLVTRFYSQAKIEDHKSYLGEAGAFGDGAPDDILLDERPAGDAWDHRSPPMSPRRGHSRGESVALAGGAYGHVRQASNASTIMNEPYQQPNQTTYEHYGNPSGSMDAIGTTPPMHEDPFRQPGEEHYGSPPQEYPPSSYRSPPRVQSPPAASIAAPTYYTTPTPHVPADQPRYQLYDKAV